MPEAATAQELELRLEEHRSELTAYCYRMLASPFEAEDAVQETFLRAWRSYEGFEGRAALRSWLYRIATNVCLDMLSGRERRARPMDLGPAQEPIEANLNTLPEVTWIQPLPTADPEEIAVSRETIRLAFVAALQHLPARQRAVLILCEVLRWKASEVAELLETSVASVNSALQRARATLEAAEIDTTQSVDEADADLLARYVKAFEAYDMDALTALIKEDAVQSMPPYDMWLHGRDRHLHVVVWAGNRVSRLAGDPDDVGERLAGVRAVQAERSRRLRAVGAPGPGGRRRWDRRAHVLPRHRHPLPALRPAATARVLAGKDVRQSHEGDELEQLVRSMEQPNGAAMPARGHLEPAKGVDRPGVRLDAPNVAEQDVGAALGHRRADAVAQPGEIFRGDRAMNGEGDGWRRGRAHSGRETGLGGKTHRRR